MWPKADRQDMMCRPDSVILVRVQADPNIAFCPLPPVAEANFGSSIASVGRAALTTWPCVPSPTALLPDGACAPSARFRPDRGGRVAAKARSD
jgi:hypothetical protein